MRFVERARRVKAPTSPTPTSAITSTYSTAAPRREGRRRFTRVRHGLTMGHTDREFEMIDLGQGRTRSRTAESVPYPWLILSNQSGAFGYSSTRRNSFLGRTTRFSRALPELLSDHPVRLA
jgi:hypothetical protein